jgi:trimethylguanosine synthase
MGHEVQPHRSKSDARRVRGDELNALSLTLVHILVVLNEWMDFSREIPYEVDVQTRVGTETYTAPLSKYWRQRYDLFSEWEMGMLLDTEAWYSTTPIIIADHQARLCVECFQRKRRSDLPPVVLDAFCGVGGNSIAFAKVGCKVLACDIDSEKLKMVSVINRD